ncbi:O-antigen ligase family protein [Aquabacterium sp. G14]|uniref:O-antigen ligase family protein n=1 Tax=Aquabacterium sp. G14 TaxID=3130164 RepID=UPI0030A2234A
MGAKAKYASIHRHQMMVTKMKQSASLEMTDYFFLFSLFIMLFWAIDPFMVGLDNIGGVKRFPTILLLMNLAFIGVGRLMFRNRSTYVSVRDTLQEMRYLVAFAALVIGGSLYAREVKGVEETFLTMGVFTLMAPITYWYTINSLAPMKLLRAILIVFTFWAVVASGMQLGFFQVHELFHSREHLVLPVLGTLLYFLPWKFGRWWGIAMVALVAVAVNKNTGYIITVFVCGYLVSLTFFRRWRAIKDRLLSTTLLVAFVSTIVLALAAVWVGYTYFDDHMPTGNPEYRLYTYDIAWQRFLSSPIWGTLFAESAVVFFGKFDVATSTQYLPTHSDPLDIMAHGGLIALTLWLMAIVPVLWRAFKMASLYGSQLAWSDEWVHQSFLLMAFTALLVCLFNPIYNVPNLATANWMVLGCVLTSTKVCERLLHRETP